MPSKMAVMRPGDGATVVPGTSWSPPIPERPLPRRQGGPLPPQPYALWSPATIDQENIVYCALFDYMEHHRAEVIREMLDALDAAKARRQLKGWEARLNANMQEIGAALSSLKRD